MVYKRGRKSRRAQPDTTHLLVGRCFRIPLVSIGLLSGFAATEGEQFVSHTTKTGSQSVYVLSFDPEKLKGHGEQQFAEFSCSWVILGELTVTGGKCLGATFCKYSFV